MLGLNLRSVIDKDLDKIYGRLVLGDEGQTKNVKLIALAVGVTCAVTAALAALEAIFLTILAGSGAVGSNGLSLMLLVPAAALGVVSHDLYRLARASYFVSQEAGKAPSRNTVGQLLQAGAARVGVVDDWKSKVWKELDQSVILSFLN